MARKKSANLTDAEIATHGYSLGARLRHWLPTSLRAFRRTPRHRLFHRAHHDAHPQKTKG